MRGTSNGFLGVVLVGAEIVIWEDQWMVSQMTLAVARISGDGVRVVGDTRLTFDWSHVRSGGVSNIFQGALKVIILHRSLCVAFAGDEIVGKQAIVDLRVLPDTTPDASQIIEELESKHKDSSHNVEFLVAALSPTPTLVAIKDGGQAGPAGNQAWIGDRAGFSRYQEAVAEAQLPPDASSPMTEDGRMMSALKAVIDDETVPSVGGFTIAALPTKEGFVYSCALRIYPGLRQTQSIPSGEWTTLQWRQSPDEGSYTEAVLAPEEPGIGAIGVHVAEARIGALYWASRFPEPQLFSDVSQEEFSRQVAESHHIRISAPIAG